MTDTLEALDRCPKCGSNDINGTATDGCDGEYLAYCTSCDHEAPEDDFWPTREELGLPLQSCAVCNRRLSYGCGHSYADELAAVRHSRTVEHLLGDCECFVSRPGYAARYTRDEWRARVAAVILAIEGQARLLSPADRGHAFQPLIEMLHGHRQPTIEEQS